MRAAILFAIVACSGEKRVECGKGTELKNGVCEIATPSISTPIDGRVADATPVIDAGSDTVRDTWTYTTTTDAMRGTTTEGAAIASKNIVAFGSPYGNSRLMILIRHEPAGSKYPGDAVILAVERGQFDCHMSGCLISYKIDDGKVEQWSAEETTNRSDALILSGEGKWIDKLRSAKRVVVVEASFFRDGHEQFEFDVSGFAWKYGAAKTPSNIPRASRGFFCQTGGKCTRTEEDSCGVCNPQDRAWCYSLVRNREQLCWDTSGTCLTFASIAGDDATDCNEVR